MTVRLSFVVAACGLAIGAVPVCGCSLLSRGPPAELRWFTPELVTAQGGAAEMQPGRDLRIGRVSSGAAIGLRVAFGDGLYEVGYYDGRRWTERPEQYVRRALEHALFEGGGFRRAAAGDAPSLDVDVVEFEEIKAPTLHAARVTLHLVLSLPSDRVLLERRVTVTAPAGEPFDAFVAAMASALPASAAEVAGGVEQALDSWRASEATR